MPDAKRRPCACRPTRIAAQLLLIALASLALAVGSGPSHAAPPPAVIRGKVTGWEKLLPQVYTEAAKNDTRHYMWREPSPTVKQEFRKLSANVSRDVCVAAMSGGSPQAHEPYAIKLTGGRLTPSTIVLPPGSRLSIKNVDPFPHVLYEVNNDKWAPSATSPGSTREWAASAPGTFQIRDQLFPSIVLYIVVDPGVVEFAYPDREGTFSMSVPQGEYTFKAFFDGKAVSKETPGVRVGDRGFVEVREPLVLGGDSK